MEESHKLSSNEQKMKKGGENMKQNLIIEELKGNEVLVQEKEEMTLMKIRQ